MAGWPVVAVGGDTWSVLIDGIPDRLAFVCFQLDGRRSYNTRGDRSQYSFKFTLKKGQKFRASGRSFEILGQILRY